MSPTQHRTEWHQPAPPEQLWRTSLTSCTVSLKLPSAVAVPARKLDLAACPTCSARDAEQRALLTAQACPLCCRYRPFIEQQLCSLFPEDGSPEVIWLPATAMLQEEGIPANLEAVAQPTEEAPTDAQVTKPARAMHPTSSVAPPHSRCATERCVQAVAHLGTQQ